MDSWGERQSFSPCWGMRTEGVSQLSCSWWLDFDFQGATYTTQRGIWPQTLGIGKILLLRRHPFRFRGIRGALLPWTQLACPIQLSMHTKYSLMLPVARPLKVTHASGWRSACLVIVLGMFHCYLHPVTFQHKNPFNVTMQSCLDFIVCQAQVRGPEESINPCEFVFQNELKDTAV